MKFARRQAVNGTGQSVDTMYGIDPKDALFIVVKVSDDARCPTLDELARIKQSVENAFLGHPYRCPPIIVVRSGIDIDVVIDTINREEVL